MKVFTFFAIYLFFQNLIFAQSVDFQDSYDYDMRNQRIETDSGGEIYKDYPLPGKKNTPFLITPKSIQKQNDASLIVPGQSPFRRKSSSSSNISNTTTANPLNSSPTTNFPIDPLTGKINADAILKTQNSRKLKQDRKEKAIEEFGKIKYEESMYRRGEVIFFMTLPFAIGFSFAAAFLVDSGNDGFIKSTSGTIFVTSFSLGLSLGNVYLDNLRYNDYLNEKKINPELERKFDNSFYKQNIEFSLPIYTLRF